MSGHHYRQLMQSTTKFYLKLTVMDDLLIVSFKEL